MLTYSILWEACLSEPLSDFCSPGKIIWQHLEADLDSFQRDDTNTLQPLAKQVMEHSEYCRWGSLHVPTSLLGGQIPQRMLVCVPAEALKCAGKIQLCSKSSLLVKR